MKRRILFLTSMLSICGTAIASDCTGDGCGIDITPTTTVTTNSDAAIVFNQNVYLGELYGDFASTQSQVEELLTPQKPSSSLWTNDGASWANNVTIIDFDGCPFETDAECEIWRKKPMVRETVSPRSTKIQEDKMWAFVGAVQSNPNIDASADVAAPLLARYKILMRAANSCCTDGFVHKLKAAGAKDGLIYKFLADDANFYGLGSRCLMTTDVELNEFYPENIATTAADVRNGCLCRNKQWFESMLAPFVDAYKTVPEFANARFNYTYVDGLGRGVTTSVNTDVQNVLNQLSVCP